LKIKASIIYLILFLIVAGVLISFVAKVERAIVIVRDNQKRVPIPVENNKYLDSQCGMLLETEEYAAEVISKEGITWFFHDPGGVPLWIKDRGEDFKKEADIWFMTLDTKKWKRSGEVWFSITDNTPMEYGFGAYEHKKKGYIPYKEMELRMLRGENMTDPRVKKALLEKANGDH
jgi:copper chaperone NosL